MDIRLLAAALLCIVWVSASRAQSAPTAAETSAMERAQREADGPRRRIMEAAKVKGTVRPDLPPPLPAPAPAVTTAPAVAVATPRREEPAERAPTLATLPAALAPVPMPAGAVAGVPTVSQVELAPAAAALIAMPATKVITLQPPRLVSKVDPEVPARLQRRGARRTTVLVEMTIAVDGSVRDVRLRDSSDEELALSVREAVQQWRYEPQPVDRPHTVQLVFEAG